MGSLEPVICRKVNDNSGIPRPIEDRCDSAVEGTADETAGVQIPLVLQLLEYRREEILGDSFTELHGYSLPLLRSPNNRTWAFPCGPWSGWILGHERMDRIGVRDCRLQDARREFLREGYGWVGCEGSGNGDEDEEKMQEQILTIWSRMIYSFDTQTSVCPDP